MSYSVSVTGPFFTSGEVRFSALRDTFKGSGTMIKASELLRQATLTTEQTDPIVPDSTENANISTGSNWATSQFRNSIKYYNITQSGTDVNQVIDNLSWNGNLNKTIRKILGITGTIGATSSASDALVLGTDSRNLTIQVSGSILGASGAGGGAGAQGSQVCGVNPGSNAGTGGGGAPGSDAISITSAGRVNVDILSTGKIYGGGGGGAGGKGGDNGADSTCSYYTYYYTGSLCASVPGCGADVQVSYSNLGGCNCVTSGKGKKTSTVCYNAIYQSYCRRETFYQVCGGYGGSGGAGTPGRGYNNIVASLAGAAGSAGQAAYCPDPNVGYAAGGVGNTGGTGENGGNGGDWGSDGESKTGAIGGLAGRAIQGSLFSVFGSIGSDNIKGLYN